MDELRLQAVAARVAAWHNQHPFAYRITPQHVHSVGYVVLPYAVPDATETSALPQRRWQAAFVENFIAPLTPPRVAQWARRHGRVLAAMPTDAPVRIVAPAPTQGEAHYRQVVVMSAAIDVGTLSTRVLMGAGTPGTVIGPRLWHGPRLAAGASAAAVVMLALSWLAWGAHVAPSQAPVMAAVVAAKPQVAAAGAVASAPTSALASVSAAAFAAASAAASAPSVERAVPAAAPAASAPMQAAQPASAAASSAALSPHTAAAAAPWSAQPPMDVQPQSGRVAMPALAGLISDEAKAAARAHRKTLPAVQAAASAPAAAVAEAATPASRALPVTPRFALATRLLRTRAEAEQFQAAMSALLRSGSAGQQGKVQTDILPEGEDWRVVGMPFTQRDEAEKTRRLLIARGMRVEVINF
jgi:hypothetical protein